MSSVSDIMKMALSPEEVKSLMRKLFNKTVDVVDYQKIIDAQDLNQFFRNNDYIIIFYPAHVIKNTTFGHYTCLIRDIKRMTYSFYDSLAYRPDEYKRFANRKLYFEEVNSLIEHLLDANLNGWQIDYNSHQHQSRKDFTVATCGRWCILRCHFGDLSNAQFNRLLNKLWRKAGFGKWKKIKDRLVASIVF